MASSSSMGALDLTAPQGCSFTVFCTIGLWGGGCTKGSGICFIILGFQSVLLISWVLDFLVIGNGQRSLYALKSLIPPFQQAGVGGTHWPLWAPWPSILKVDVPFCDAPPSCLPTPTVEYSLRNAHLTSMRGVLIWDFWRTTWEICSLLFSSSLSCLSFK